MIVGGMSMKRYFSGALAIAALVSLAAMGGAGDVAAETNFTTVLKPNRAIFPSESSARGTATLRLSGDGRTLYFQVDAFDVGTISQIHIHLGEVATTPEGEHYHRPPEEGHGGTVGFLLNFSPNGYVGNGTVAKGTLTATDLLGPLKGQPMKVLEDHLRKGWAYVNVHIVQEFGQGRQFCCPTGLRGVLQPD